MASSFSPHFSHVEWNCRQPVGGETWEDVELCDRFVLGSTSNRESFSPSAFQLGEKVPKADEGAFYVRHSRAFERSRTSVGTSHISRKAPPSSAFGTFSPRQTPRGGRTLDDGSGQ